MILSPVRQPILLQPRLNGWLCFFALIFVLQTASLVFSQQSPGSGIDEMKAVVINDSTDGDVFGLGKSVIVRGEVKQGVMAFGGDVVVEGRVGGDVATIGGSVYQRAGSYIGGDVVVIGGAYNHGKTAPGRNPESQTVMYAGYEEELREAMQNPASLVAPDFSAWYLIQRILSILFWFVLSLGLTTFSPGAISRAIVRLNLSSVRVALTGALAMLISTVVVLFWLGFLPSPFGFAAGLMLTIGLFLAYVFGRVVVQATTGKFIYKRIFGEHRRSDSTALLFGAFFWTFVLSLPYFWAFAFVGLIVVSLGLVLTARFSPALRNA